MRHRVVDGCTACQFDHVEYSEVVGSSIRQLVLVTDTQSVVPLEVVEAKKREGDNVY